MLADFQHALRSLLRAPGFAVSAALTLALGIGLNAAVFSVVDAALFRPLPYKDAHELVNVYQIVTTVDGRRVDAPVTAAQVELLRSFSHVFAGVEVVRFARRIALTTNVDHNPWIGGFAPGLPDLLGVHPQIGRPFTREDVLAQDAIILSDNYWTRVYGRNPQAIGQTVALSDRNCTIVGIMPATFRYFAGAQADAWVAIGDREGSDLAARLRPGLTVARAQREVDAALARLPTAIGRAAFWIRPTDWRRSASPPGRWTSVRTQLPVVSIAVWCVLLIGCANVANLLLVRGLTRQREIAVRSALGATRGRLVRLLFAEVFLLVVLGGALGAVVAWFAIWSVSAFIPTSLALPLLDVAPVQPDLRVLAFGFLTVVVSTVCCGVVPAVRSSSSSFTTGALSQSDRLAGSLGQRRTRHVFQVLQTALTLVLLAGGAQLLGRLYVLLTTAPGFDPTQLMYVQFTFPAQSSAGEPETRQFVREFIARVTSVPGVQLATIGPPPVAEAFAIERVRPVGEPNRAVVVSAERFYVGAEYFQTVRITLKEGRTFGLADSPKSPRVIIVSENIAKRIWGRESAVGRSIEFGAGGRSYTIVGVVSDVKIADVENDGVELFLSATQANTIPGLLLRTTIEPAATSDLVRAMVAELNPRVVVQRIGTVEHLIEESDVLGTSRAYASVVAAIAGLGLLTTAVGLYAMVMFALTQRTREIGVRLALGASSANVRRILIQEAFGPLCIGIGVGVPSAYVASRLLASQVAGLAELPFLAIAAVVTVFLVVSAITLVAPIRHVARISPADALRVD